MDGQSQSIQFPLGKAIVLTILASFSIEIVLMLFVTLGGDRAPSLVPWTFHSFWEIAALAGIAWVVNQLKVKFLNYIAVLFFGSIISAAAWLFIPDSLNILEASYCGVESRASLDMHEEGRYDEQMVYDSPLSLGFMYHRDSPKLKNELKEETERNAYVNIQGFLTWQTGLAYGFIPDPVSIPQYNGCDNLRERLFLIATVGPVVLSELFICGINRYLIILLLAQIIFYFIRKEHVWWSK